MPTSPLVRPLLLACAVFLVLLSACRPEAPPAGPTAGSAPTAEPAEPEPSEPTPAASPGSGDGAEVEAALDAAAAEGSAASAELAAPDLSTPVGPVAAVFDALAAGDVRHLAGVCDPQGSNDELTASLCALGAADGEMMELFGEGRLNGDPVMGVDDSGATVPVLIGPDAAESRWFQVVKRGESWYLYGLVD